MIHRVTDFVTKKSKKEGKIQKSINQIPHLPRDIKWESDKNTIKYPTQESQEANPFTAGDHKAAKNSQESVTDTKHK